MLVNTDTRHGVTFIRVTGSLDITNTDRFEEIVTGIMQENSARIVFDLSECMGITSKALGLLMWAKAEAKGSGGDIFLLSPHPKVLSLLRLIGLGEVLQTVNSQEEAIKLLT
ncbi:MAG: STAS domain-containing protein [Planctomycetota bacterium]|jgi:anti-anti-sigma factor